jgi:hypothetical protein
MPWESFHIAKTLGRIMREGGLRTSRWVIPRYNAVGLDPYGDSPAIDAHPSLRTLQRMKKSNIVGANRAVEPTMISGGQPIGKIKLLPNYINAGLVGSRGEPLLQPILPGQGWQFGLDVQDGEKNAVKEHFFLTLFDLLVETPRMTATQALQRTAEKGALLQPVVSQMQTEELEPTIAIEMDILQQEGGIDLDDVPPELQDLGVVPWEASYRSPLMLQIMAQDAAAIAQWLEFLMPLADRDPRVRHVVDAVNVGQMMAEILGVPAAALSSPQAIAEAIRQDQAAQQQQQLAATAPAVADLARARRDLQEEAA